MCGKRFGNQWFWQVGALLVALQVYNHSFRGSIPRLGNRSLVSTPSLSRRNRDLERLAGRRAATSSRTGEFLGGQGRSRHVRVNVIRLIVAGQSILFPFSSRMKSFERRIGELFVLVCSRDEQTFNIGLYRVILEFLFFQGKFWRGFLYNLTILSRKEVNGRERPNCPIMDHRVVELRRSSVQTGQGGVCTLIPSTGHLGARVCA